MSYRVAASLLAALAVAYFGWWESRYRQDPAYLAAVAYVQETTELAGILGGSVHARPFPTGRVRESESRGSLRVAARGMSGRGRVTVDLRRGGGGWHVASARLGDVELPPSPGWTELEARRGIISATDRGYALLQNGRAREAEALLRQWIAADPGHAETHYVLGQVLEELGEREAALAAFLEAVALDPGDARYHYEAGATSGRMGRLVESVGHIDRALALDPDEGIYWFGRAAARDRLGDYAGRNRDLETACARGYAPGCDARRRAR